MVIYICPMIIHSSNFLIKANSVSKEPFSGNNNRFSINYTVIQVKISDKNTMNFSIYP